MTEMLTIVPAGAGSGKTFRIKSDLTKWVKDKLVSPERILAVTFTEAAAAELRGRIRSSLISEGLVEQALAVEQAYVSTIHGLGLRVLSEHAFAAGASPQPRALAEAERDLLIRQAMAHATSLDAVKADLPRFGYRSSFVSNASLEDSFRGKVLSTIDLLRGLGDSGNDPKLAKTAVERLRDLYGEVASDPAPLEARLTSAIEALIGAFPNDLTPHATSDAARKAFAKDFRLLKRALRTGELSRDWKLWKALSELRQTKRGSPTPEGYDDLSSEVIAAASDIAIHPGPLDDACAHLEALVHGAQEVMSKYADMKREAGVIDYADMICDAERLLRTRPEILEALLSEIDCVIIDEFQDTNPVQFALLWRIAQSAKRVLIVGDTKQSIMGFQGADPRLSQALEKQNPDAASPLTGNWRSDPRLMKMVNAISQGLFGDGYVALDPQRPETGQTFAEVLRIPEGRRSKKSRPEDHVAARVADLLAERGPIVEREGDPKVPVFRPVEPRDIALLCPTHSMAARYASALKRQGIPVRINAPGWLDSPAVMAARNALSFAVDPTDRHAALALLTLGPASIPLQQAMTALADGELEACAELADLLELAKAAPEMPLEALLPKVLEAAGILEWAAAHPDAAQLHADLMRFQAEITDFVSAHRDFKAAAGFHGASAQVFLGWLEARRDERDFDRHPDPGQSQEQGVEIVTWHASKGREWPITAIVGLDAKIGERPGTLRAEFTNFSDLGTILEHAKLIWTPDLPIKEKKEIFLADRREASEADARRLLYVALTRARDRLILEWPEFGLKKLGESEGPANHAEMLVLEAGLEPEAGYLSLRDASFPARTLICSSESPELPVLSQSEEQGRLAFGQPRPLLETAVTPWRVRPSLIEPKVASEVRTRLIKLDVPPQSIAMEGTATDRGTALHKAFRVLLMRPDLRSRLASATGFDQSMLDALQEQAKALRSWLTAEGYTQIDCEVPIQKRKPSGAEFNGMIDLLARGPDKCLILDHKSGSGSFADYIAQLKAYQDVLVQQKGFSHPSVSIHWIDDCSVEVSVVR
ncbi:UvrD-helicase domain-containing protein [Sulfitobacter sp. JBTF-M27]|uniref:DNA 3'-5' helicase n=1 Tax=Sulfitobacter sediminilitoris TaxID=2698830 RepID=A0A6P0CFM6_9RHOB|nr:UvrD-helicase domain-containing protein [Sulfitobacter sediminilitoris]NEK24190.1 UvrD-helicase domain-containing protein [Sulfitobacter sediminilitoris]